MNSPDLTQEQFAALDSQDLSQGRLSEMLIAEVTDGAGGKANAGCRISVDWVNEPPSIQAPGTLQIEEDHAVEIQGIAVHDIDAHILVHSTYEMSLAISSSAVDGIPDGTIRLRSSDGLQFRKSSYTVSDYQIFSSEVQEIIIRTDHRSEVQRIMVTRGKTQHLLCRALFRCSGMVREAVLSS